MAFEFIDRDYKERKVVLEIDPEFDIFSVAIYKTGGRDYMSGIISLEEMRKQGLFIQATGTIDVSNTVVELDIKESN